MALLLAIISLWNVFVFLSAFVLPCVREFRAGCSLDCALTFQLFHCPTQRPWQAAPLFFHCHLHTQTHTHTSVFCCFPSQASRDQQEAEKCEWKKKYIYILFVFLSANVIRCHSPVGIWKSLGMVFEPLVMALESLLFGAGVKTDVKNSWGVFRNILLFSVLRLSAWGKISRWLHNTWTLLILSSVPDECHTFVIFRSLFCLV